MSNEQPIPIRESLGYLDPDQLAKTYGAAIASRLTGGRVIDLGGRDRRQENDQ